MSFADACDILTGKGGDSVKRNTGELALSSLMAALGVVFLCLGGIIPFALYACPILASAVLIPVRENCRKSYGWCCYAVIAVLGLLLGPDKEAAALFLFLGYYPLIQPKLNVIRSRALRLACKLGIAVFAIGTMYAVLLYVIGLASVVEEFAATAPWMLWTTAGLGIAVFLLYDVLLGRLNNLFARWFRRH